MFFTRNFMRRYGEFGVITSKFGGVIRPVVPLIAGAMGMSTIRFFIASPVSCLIWAGACLSPGYALTATFG